MAKITQDDIKELKTVFATKEDIISFKDAILKEIKDMRDEGNIGDRI
jgi:hypothetical protein